MGQCRQAFWTADLGLDPTIECLLVEPIDKSRAIQFLDKTDVHEIARPGGSRRREFGTKLIEDGLDSLDRGCLFPFDRAGVAFIRQTAIAVEYSPELCSVSL